MLTTAVIIVVAMRADVKPDNILIDQAGDIKLCDFGASHAAQPTCIHG